MVSYLKLSESFLLREFSFMFDGKFIKKLHLLSKIPDNYLKC
jgi:hypothetical protein